MEIEIIVGNRWENNEEELAKRIARVVCYSDKHCIQQSSGYKWSLNCQGNDWKMSEIEDGVVRVSYRYGYGHTMMMNGLQTFLQWSIGKKYGEVDSKPETEPEPEPALAQPTDKLKNFALQKLCLNLIEELRVRVEDRADSSLPEWEEQARRLGVEFPD